MGNLAQPHWRGLLALGALFLCAGCGREADALRQNAATAVLEGRVSLAPGAALPVYAAADLARRTLNDIDARAVPVECDAAMQAARAPVARTAQGLLTGIVIAASDFTHHRERKPKVHRLAIDHCRLLPTVLAGMSGDWVELENRDAFAFAPLVGPGFSVEPLAHGKKIRFPLIASSVQSLLCSRDAPCGRTDLIAFHHPVYAVTDAQGTFRIENFPAGEPVRISAWHPLFRESQTFVWLKPGERGRVELQLEPHSRFLP